MCQGAGDGCAGMLPSLQGDVAGGLCGTSSNLCPIQMSGRASFILPSSTAPNRHVLSLGKRVRGFLLALPVASFSVKPCLLQMK